MGMFLSTVLTIATCVMAYVYFRMYEGNKEMLQNQDKLLKLNFIVAMIAEIKGQDSMKGVYVKEFYDAVNRASPGLGSEIDDWFKNSNLFKKHIT